MLPATRCAWWAYRAVLLVSLSWGSTVAGQADPLPSWTDSQGKARILAFVESVTASDSDTFVPVAERIAVFDNDGTLWSEKPLYFQLLYAIDYIRSNVGSHPEWREKQPFKAVLEDDMEALAAGGEEGVLRLVMASHAGMTSTEFEESVRAFMEAARHPSRSRRYVELVYQPMLELLAYLRANGFRTWIVSGGGIDFLRTFAEDAYGVVPEQVVGSQIELRYELRAGSPVLVREPKLAFVDDKAGKPVAIMRHIGRRPIAAFGNSDGDLQMLQYTCIDRQNTLCAIVRHTDGEREWAYDRDSRVGRLDAALDEAEKRGWLVIDMKSDWGTVYPFEDALAGDP